MTKRTVLGFEMDGPPILGNSTTGKRRRVVKTQHEAAHQTLENAQGLHATAVELEKSSRDLLAMGQALALTFQQVEHSCAQVLEACGIPRLHIYDSDPKTGLIREVYDVPVTAKEMADLRAPESPKMKSKPAKVKRGRP